MIFFFFTGRQFKRVKLVLVFFSAGLQAILNTSQVRNVLEWPLTGTQDTPL